MRVDNFTQLLEVVYPRQKLTVIDEDPDDNKVLEAAVEANADFIISGDKHLLNLRQFSGIKIVTARQFLDLFE